VAGSAASQVKRRRPGGWQHASAPGGGRRRGFTGAAAHVPGHARAPSRARQACGGGQGPSGCRPRPPPHAAPQIVTLVVWCAGRFFLYTSYYSIFGALFGFTNFGRMVAIDNAVNGLFGLLQLPLTNWGINGLGGNFTAINLLQARPRARA